MFCKNIYSLLDKRNAQKITKVKCVCLWALLLLFFIAVVVAATATNVNGVGCSGGDSGLCAWARLMYGILGCDDGSKSNSPIIHAL